VAVRVVLEQPHFDTSPANGGEVNPLHVAVVRIERHLAEALTGSKGSVMDDNYFCRPTTTTSAGRSPY
jgi:hypothetical protein